MKHCIDCMYFVRSIPGFEKCSHPQLMVESPVTGKIEPMICTAARMMAGGCGPNAELFKPNSHYADLATELATELERDKKIDAQEEQLRDAAERRTDFDFERDCGARP